MTNTTIITCDSNGYGWSSCKLTHKPHLVYITGLPFRENLRPDPNSGDSDEIMEKRPV